MNAYSEYYLNDAKTCLGDFFSYMLDDLGYSAAQASALFISSGYAELFALGNPGVIAGMSGAELARKAEKKIIEKDVSSSAYKKSASGSSMLKEQISSYSPCKTPSYWAGWALAEYQWFSGRRFKDIFSFVPLQDIISMYKVYHEMDISAFLDEMERRIESASRLRETNLKLARESRGLSQSELSKRSGVHLRSIQMYEQRQNEINKAQGSTLYRLSVVLGVRIEDLLENRAAL